VGFHILAFTPFLVSEIEIILGLYIFNGLAPSPHVENKFKLQKEDHVQGNVFIAGICGPNSVRHLKHFKAFFSVQNPMMPPQNCKTNPDSKVDLFLAWIGTVAISTAWILGATVSIDEQTIGFQDKM
jgi:hypothetical protein